MAKKEPLSHAELHPDVYALAKIDRNLAFTTFPELFDPIFLRPCTVRILMVTDGGGSFGTSDFGLRELLDILAISPGPYVRFVVTRAHRESDPDADIENFTFAHGSLDDYDELWMFAVTPFGELPVAERAVITTFMNGGGGVFATGDHESLGVAMAGQIPRVKSMRKWYYPSAGPNGEPVAPSGSDENRYDTLRVDAAGEWHFDNQSDNIPQEIEPRWYGTRFPLWRGRYPHPLLCGPRGVIRILPDHPHEGECYRPSDLTTTYDLGGGVAGDEYPLSGSGVRVAPEVIAWATVIGGHETDGKPPVKERRFGVIGAYDGHETKTGRVVVDATWHHFFNINLIGDPGGGTPVKQQGFKHPSTPAGVYDDIKAYFRNIAVWLARPKQLICMRQRAFWIARWKYPLLEYLEAARGKDRIEPHELRVIGAAARDVLGRIAGRCMSIWWLLDLIAVEASLHPWKGPEEKLDPDAFDPGPTFDAAIGGAFVELARRFPNRKSDVREKVAADVDEVLTRGLRETFAAEAMRASDRNDELRHFAASFAERRQTDVD